MKWLRNTLSGLVFLLALLLVSLPLGAQGRTQDQDQKGGEDLLSGFESEEEEGEESPSNGAAKEEDLESGFDDEGEEEEITSGKPLEEGQRFWEIGGFIRLDGSYNYAHDAPVSGQKTDYRGLSKLRLALRLELTLHLGEGWEAFISGQTFRDFAYQINGRDQYSAEVLEQHEQETEFREVFLRGSLLPSLDLTFGRQIVAWGKSDNIRVVDILNPLDFREPGLTDLADLRLPLSMTRLDYYFGDWGLSTIAIHEIRFDKNPAIGSDFFPVDPGFQEVVPDNGGENTEYALALSGIFSGWDLAFYWAQVFDDTFHLEDVDTGPGLDLKFVHAKLTMVGLAANVALGNWLLKSEAARFTGLKFFGVPDRTFTRVDGLLGVEYSGITDNTLSLEAVDRHIAEFDKTLELFPDFESEDIVQYVFTYRGKFLREKLDLVAVLSYFGAQADEGSLQRYSATYEVATALDLTGGVVIFTPGNGESLTLQSAKDNDRVFFDLKWSF